MCLSCVALSLYISLSTSSRACAVFNHTSAVLLYLFVTLSILLCPDWTAARSGFTWTAVKLQQTGRRQTHPRAKTSGVWTSASSGERGKIDCVHFAVRSTGASSHVITKYTQTHSAKMIRPDKCLYLRACYAPITSRHVREYDPSVLPDTPQLR